MAFSIAAGGGGHGIQTMAMMMMQVFHSKYYQHHLQNDRKA
jgi:hypothetical protein